MKTTTNHTGRTFGKVGLLTAGLCIACCALPILGFVGGTGIIGSLALYTENIVWSVIAIALIGGTILYFKKHKHTCSIDCDCKNHHSTTDNTLSK